MVTQESVNGHHEHSKRRRTDGPSLLESQAFLSRVKVVWCDASRLAKLQTRLLIADYQAYRRRLILPAIALFCAIIVLISAVPITMLGSSLMIAEAFDLRIDLVLLVLGTSTVLLAIIIAVLAARRVTRAFREFDRTRIELTNNLNWIMDALGHPE